MSRYSPKAQKAIEKAMDEFSDGKLKSSSGDTVTNRKQALAIGISIAREKGYKVPNDK